MDPCDRATEIETWSREDAIRRARRVAHSMTGQSEEFCLDCGAEIPEARRRAIPGCKRCVDCQSMREASA